MTELATIAGGALDVERLRTDFPILRREVSGQPLVYLDSAATSQKPVQVLDAVDAYYRRSNANVHRGVHTLAAEATDLYENARVRVARFIDAPPEGVVFVRNTTEALNLVAHAYAGAMLQPGDRIVLTVMEHHSNLVPWQQVAQLRGLCRRLGSRVANASHGEEQEAALQHREEQEEQDGQQQGELHDRLAAAPLTSAAGRTGACSHSAPA